MRGYVLQAQSMGEALERIERLRAAGALQELADWTAWRWCMWAGRAACSMLQQGSCQPSSEAAA